jgi:hypothetical protein
MITSMTRRWLVAAFACASLVATCSSESEPETTAETTTTVDFVTDAILLTDEIWADHWFVLWVNGELIGEDSVPITTERSFNAETFEFEATYPLTIAIEAKDFKETESGIEYIDGTGDVMLENRYHIHMAEELSLDPRGLTRKRSTTPPARSADRSQPAPSMYGAVVPARSIGFIPSLR